ncbi:GDP-mannose 4,6 dehydratase, partial [Pseudomonas syringae pv. tagetis]|uniref:NAD-dependent epimerase/dehydratase family protein n=1 Tax=Pseudomonas syringae group genomosp. 7 TaxID=251699 RepID=UPI00376F5DF6
MSIAGKRALITGFNGFTGRFMANALAAQGCEVLGDGSRPSDRPCYYQVALAAVAGVRSLRAATQPG